MVHVIETLWLFSMTVSSFVPLSVESRTEALTFSPQAQPYAIFSALFSGFRMHCMHT